MNGDTPRTSRALVLDEFGTLPRLEEREVPAPRPGHTLVRLRAAQVSHLDLNIIDGAFGVLPELPFVPGTTGSGTVVASGTHPEGTLVSLRGADTGIRADGAWQEHILVPDDAVTPVPEGTDPAIACSYWSPVGTALAAVHTVGRVQEGERVLVTGAAGSVGAMAVQIAARAGAEVIGAVGRESKLAHVPGAAKPVLAGELSAETVGGPVDLVVDTVGGPVLRAALPLVRGRGRVALVGYTAGRELTVDLADFLLADVSLLPVNLMTRGDEVREEAQSLLPALNAGELTLSIERFGLERLPEAIDRLRRGELVGKPVLELP
ncbi:MULTISPECIES: zinc-binding dehydrogenase [unclassified Streptomyces]|uniref:quinone oxidoreductase family protein n=1 Tax=unclassified Streptomyces TaxID=2593676 RepID=UPI00278C164F|nr:MULTISPECIES: zinc-binding dehydrogenase [unclassified Streptomyces]